MLYVKYFIFLQFFNEKKIVYWIEKMRNQL